MYSMNDPANGFEPSSSKAFAVAWKHLYGEFDPGSGRTLAACLIHASRATKPEGVTLPVESGERVSNTWVTCPRLRDNNGKPLLIPDNPSGPHGPQGKVFRSGSGPRPISLLVG